jgi:GT2 family glycosyltransferase
VKRIMDNWPKVGIIVLNWNGWRYTVECLESLQRLMYPNYQAIVVDNGSTDDSLQKIKAWARGEILVESKFFNYDPTNKPIQWIEYDRATAEAGGVPKEEAKHEGLHSNRKLILVQSGENLGFAGGNNIGIQYALYRNTQYILLLNNDTVVLEDTLLSCMQVMRDRADIGVLGCELLNRDRTKQASTHKFPSLGTILRRTALMSNADDPTMGQSSYRYVEEYVKGAFLLLRTAALGEVGLFDEQFFMYSEEADLCWRMKQAGWRVVFYPGAAVFHLGGGSTGDSERMVNASKVNRLVSRLRFIRKHRRSVHYWVVRCSYLLYYVGRFLISCTLLRTADASVYATKIRAVLNLKYLQIEA